MAKFKVGDRVVGDEMVAKHWDVYQAGTHGKRSDFAVTKVQENYTQGKAGCQLDGVVWWNEEHLTLAASPAIRTVTRREIVPGVYGVARVWAPLGNDIVVAIEQKPHTASDLRAAAKLFNELADVLDENAGAM